MLTARRSSDDGKVHKAKKTMIGDIIIALLPCFAIVVLAVLGTFLTARQDSPQFQKPKPADPVAPLESHK
jgi:hypothetical protein